MTASVHHIGTTYEVVYVDPRGDHYIYGEYSSLEEAQESSEYIDADFIQKTYPNGEIEDVWVSEKYTARREQERAEARQLVTLLRKFGLDSMTRLPVKPQSDWADMDIRLSTRSWFRLTDLVEAMEGHTSH